MCFIYFVIISSYIFVCFFSTDEAAANSPAAHKALVANSTYICKVPSKTSTTATGTNGQKICAWAPLSIIMPISIHPKAQKIIDESIKISKYDIKVLKLNILTTHILKIKTTRSKNNDINPFKTPSKRALTLIKSKIKCTGTDWGACILAINIPRYVVVAVQKNSPKNIIIICAPKYTCDFVGVKKIRYPFLVKKSLCKLINNKSGIIVLAAITSPRNTVEVISGSPKML